MNIKSKINRTVSCFVIFIFVICAISLLSGCGETVHGVVKDTGRIGKGVKTIFFRDSKGTR